MKSPAIQNPKSKIQNWIVARSPHLALATVILLALCPLLPGEFTTWDDTVTIANNPDFRPVTWRTPLVYWTNPHMHLYAPLTYTVWSGIAAVDQVIFGDDPAQRLHPILFHIANLLVHITTALVIFSLLRRLIHHQTAAWFGAALFALHPIQVEAIGWISGMKDLLCALFIWTAVLRYIIFVESDRHATWNWIIATFAFVAALLAKPTAMVTPAIVLALQLLLLPRQKWTRLTLLLAPWFLISLAWAIITQLVQPTTVPILDWWHRPMIALDAIAFYMGKFIAPFSLTIDYGRHPVAVLAGPDWWIWAITVALFSLLIVFRHHRILLVAATFFVLPLAPLLGFVPFDFQQYSTVSDHYAYPATAGIALAFAWMISKSSRLWVYAASGIFLLVFGILSFNQTFVWQNTRTLFNHVLAVNPKSWAAYNTLAGLDRMENRPHQAFENIQKAIEVGPPSAMSYATKGLILMDRGDAQAAEASFRKALEYEPTNADVMVNLGVLLASSGKVREAGELWQQAVNADPRCGLAHINLGVLMYNLNRLSEALNHLTIGVRLSPDDLGGRLALGQLLLETGHPTESAHHFAIAKRLRSESN